MFKRFQKQKLSSLLTTYFYKNLHQGYSDSSDSPRSKGNSIEIKEEEMEIKVLENNDSSEKSSIHGEDNFVDCGDDFIFQKYNNLFQM
jgi:hypothetical protein